MKKDEIRNAKIAANWIKDLHTSVVFIELKKKVYNRDGWRYRYTYNVRNYNSGEWTPVDIDTLYNELGIPERAGNLSGCSFGDILNHYGFTALNQGSSVVVLGKDAEIALANAKKKMSAA